MTLRPDGAQETPFLGSSFDDFAHSLEEARIFCYDEEDEYFGERRDGKHPINPRNEAAALSLALRKIKTDPDLQRWLEDYNAAVEQSTTLYGSPPPKRLGRDFDPGENARLRNFERWWVFAGGEGCFVVDYFHDDSGDCRRGLAASSSLESGACALAVPLQFLIHSKTARESDLGRALEAVGLKSDELLTVIWTMIDARDAQSELKAFWDILPRDITTGLGFGAEQVEWLKGTAAYEDIVNAQQSIRVNYESVKPLLESLQAAYPDVISTEAVSYPSYLWAVQLWYAYAMEVEFVDGELVSCLVPGACLMNHASWPHIIRYGRVDIGSQCLRFEVFRSCEGGTELTMSYGPLSNQKLLTYYGFTLDRNPFDAVSFDLEAFAEEDSGLQNCGSPSAGIKSRHKLRSGNLSPSLIRCCNVMSSPKALEIVSDSETALTISGTALLISILSELRRPLLSLPLGHALLDASAHRLCSRYRSELLSLLESVEKSALQLVHDLANPARIA